MNDENAALAVHQDVGRDFITTTRTSRCKNYALYFGLILRYGMGYGRANDKTHVRTRRLIYTKIVVFGTYTSVVRAVSVGFSDVRVRPVPRLQIDGNAGPRSRRQVFAFASANVCVRITPFPYPRERTNKSETPSKLENLLPKSGLIGGMEKNTKKTLATDIIKKPNRSVAKANEPAKRRTYNTFTTGVRGPFTRVILA